MEKEEAVMVVEVIIIIIQVQEEVLDNLIEDIIEVETLIEEIIIIVIHRVVKWIFSHYTGKQQMVTYDTVKDHIVKQIQKIFKYGNDIAQVIRDMVYVLE